MNLPLTLPGNADDSLVTLMRQELTGEEQQMFINNFHMYTMYDAKRDFVIDLDDVWEWVGYSRKDAAKRVVERDLTVNVHYRMDGDDGVRAALWRQRQRHQHGHQVQAPPPEQQPAFRTGGRAGRPEAGGHRACNNAGVVADHPPVQTRAFIPGRAICILYCRETA